MSQSDPRIRLVLLALAGLGIVLLVLVLSINLPSGVDWRRRIILLHEKY